MLNAIIHQSSAQKLSVASVVVPLITIRKLVYCLNISYMNKMKPVKIYVLFNRFKLSSAWTANAIRTNAGTSDARKNSRAIRDRESVLQTESSTLLTRSIVRATLTQMLQSIFSHVFNTKAVMTLKTVVSPSVSKIIQTTAQFASWASSISVQWLNIVRKIALE